MVASQNILEYSDNVGTYIYHNNDNRANNKTKLNRRS